MPELCQKSGRSCLFVEEMDASKVVLRFILDVLSIVFVFLPLIIIKAGINPFHRGFFCDDSSIRYPYKSSTIPGIYLDIVAVVLPSVIFLIIELMRWKLLKTDEVFLVKGYRFPKALLAWYNMYTVYLFGMGLNQSITNIGKFSVGRPRPHFMDVMSPNITSELCTDQLGFSRYVTETDVFLGSDAHRMKEARLSFPSGHTSIATYSALFTIIYLQVRLRWRAGSQLACHVIQAVLAMAAIYTSLTRISDYKHHWSDVVGGAVVGITVAALSAIHLSDLYKRPRLSYLLSHLSQLTTADKDTPLSSPVKPDIEQQVLEENFNQNNAHLTAPDAEPSRVSTGSYYDNRDVHYRCSDHSSHPPCSAK